MLKATDRLSKSKVPLRATTVACQRHLKINAIHYAQDVVGMSRTERTATTDIVPLFQPTDPATIR